MGIEIKKLSPELVDDWTGYFDEIAFSDHGEWALCYCLEGHMTRQDNEDLKDPTERKNLARSLIKEEKMQGYLAYDDGKVVGWCNVNERENYAYLDELFSYAKYERTPGKTKAVFCFLVSEEHRGKGIANDFLNRICEDSKAEGFERVEAYPFADAGMEFQFHGTAKMYERNGFEKIAD